LPGGSSGLALTGETQLIFQWDGGRVEDLHPEFADGANTRVFNLDFEILDEVTHATQVAGVMSAAGIEPGVRGMAPESSLFAYDLLGNTQTESEGPEIRQAADLQGMQLSNHSYGVRRGWEAIVSVFRTIVLPVEGSPGAQATLTPGNYWAWGGNIDLDPNHSHHFGLYNARSEEVDANAYDFPYHLGVWSAGNQHAKSDPLGGQGLYVTFNDQGALVSNLPRPNNGATRGGYETISDQNLAKNILSVGAVDDILGGYTGVGSVQNVDATFSSRGPTDDGRIKPDIMANGWELYSTDLEGINYSNATGTSFSSPSVTGSIALLKEHHLTLLAEVVDGVQGEIDPTLYRPLLSSSLRALVCHTADEAGSHAGPDYRFGWGLMNSERAAHVISDNFVSGMHQSIKEVRLNEDGDVVLSAVALGSEPLKITIAWTDPAGVPPGDVADNRAPMLVNDLDLRVSDGVSVTFPWVLDVENPSFAASRGDNVVDNIEQVLIPNPVPGLRYEITISHKGDLADGFQWVSIVMTGHELDRVDLHVEELALDVSGDLSMLWTSVVGQMYQVQTSSDNSLSPSSWVDLGAPISANREELSVPLDVEPSDTRRFFRVIEVETEFF